MPTLSIAALLTPTTRETVEAKILTLLASAGFPTTSWQSTSVPRALVGAFSVLYALLSLMVCQIAAAGFLSTSRGDFLTVLASEVYATDRQTGAFAIGSVTLTSSAAAPTTTIPAGSYLVISRNGLVFRNVAPVTISASSSAAMTVQAESIGAIYNVGGEALSSGTPLPGLTLTAAAGLAWLTGAGVQTGVDVESEASLVARCRAKWSTLGVGASADAYIYNARLASVNVVRVRVDKAFPKPGQVSLVIASQTGTVGPADAALVLARVEPPLCVKLNVSAARLRTVTIRGPVSVRRLSRDTAIAALTTAMASYEGSTLPGDLVDLSEIIAMVRSLPGVTGYVPKRGDGSTAISGVDDVQLERDEVVSLVNSVSWVLV